MEYGFKKRGHWRMDSDYNFDSHLPARQNSISTRYPAPEARSSADNIGDFLFCPGDLFWDGTLRRETGRVGSIASSDTYRDEVDSQLRGSAGDRPRREQTGLS